jgi:thiol-disulfide isomerase/thioredoxin
VRNFTFLLALVAALGLTFYFWISGNTRQGGNAVLTLPELKAAGWLNGSAPSPESLAGKVVVIEAWATWCLPCRQAAPIIKDVHRKYSPAGVVFISLTNETSSHLRAIEAVMKESGTEWLSGYGAGAAWADLQVDGIPAVWVFGRDGRLVWSDHPGYRNEFERSIATALSAEAPNRRPKVGEVQDARARVK